MRSDMFNNILIPFEIGFIPRAALITAAALAHDGAELTLLHVSDPLQHVTAASLSVVTDEDVTFHESLIRRATGDVMAILSEYGVRGNPFVLPDRTIHRAINRFAKEIDADLIIMGTHGRRGLSRFFWGSVTEDVLREATIPVVVVRERRGFQPIFKKLGNPV